MPEGVGERGMRVRLLGPMELVNDGVVGTLTAQKLRHVLALLAMRANSIVPVEQLILELWDDKPPLSAMTTLQTYIYQLRKRLQLRPSGTGNGGGSALSLRTCPGGYVLQMPTLSVDASMFEELAERGRNELSVHGPEQAVKTLRAALSLWRGPAFADVEPGPVLGAAAVRLAELRKSVLERRIDVDIRLGRHHELVSELTGLVAANPTHEGFHARLMLALHQAGRRSEALAAYLRARMILATELGIEPSQELQRMHRAVLTGDIALTGDTAVERPMGVTYVRREPIPPKQLPPDVAGFVGRGSELARVHETLTTRIRTAPALVVVLGQPGAGKSGFCVHIAHDVAAAFPDGQFFGRLTNADGAPLPSSAVLADFLVAAGFSRAELPESLEERVALFRTWSAGRKILVVLDDVVDYGQVASLLPGDPRCAILLASRRRLSVPSVSLTCELPPLNGEDARRLLVSIMDAQRVDQDPAATSTLLRLCAGSPLPRLKGQGLVSACRRGVR